MNQFLTIAVMFFCFGPILLSQNGLFERALSAYEGGQLEESISLLEQLKDQDQVSEELYYNLGLAYYHTDQLSMAITNFHRALLLNPRHIESTSALELAQSQISTPITKIPDFIIYELFVRIAETLSISTWTIIQLVLLLFILILIYQMLFGSSSLKFSGTLIGVLLLVSIWSYANAHFLKERIISPAIVVIQSDATELYVGADARSEVITTVGEGVTAQLLDELDGWMKIELADKDIGWIQIEKVIIV